MFKYVFLLFLCFNLAFILPAHAAEEKATSLFEFQDKDRWLIRVRAVSVDPDEDSSTSISGAVTADGAVVPELDFSYFFTKNVAAELILATSPHDMGAVNTDLGNLDLGDVWVLPPTLTLQYHFLPDNKFRPYAGAGVNYTIFYGEDESSDIADISYEDGFGYALQAGFDYEIEKHWALNVDVKKIYLNTDVSINSGGVTADVDLDPWVFGVGAAYRF